VVETQSIEAVLTVVLRKPQTELSLIRPKISIRVT